MTEIEKAKELLEANGFEVKLKSKWINGELGVIFIDHMGHKIYEDIIHDLGDGFCRYYIQTPSVDNGKHYIIPEREDIPESHWGMIVGNRWVQWTKYRENGSIR